MQKSDSLMTRGEKIFYFFLVVSGALLLFTFGFWWFFVPHIPQNFSGYLHILDFLVFGILSYIIWYQIIMELHSWIVAWSMKTTPMLSPKPGLKVAFLTAFVPGKEPYEILERTLPAMVKNKYPHDTWVLDEGDDEYVKRICRLYGAKHFSRKNIQKYNQPSGKYKNKTKGGNYNAWFDKHGDKYDIVAQLDVDFAPQEDYLYKTIGYFNNPNVAFVGTPQIYGNISESWIAKGAAEQAYGFYGFGQRGFFGNNMQLFIGSNHVTRVKALKDIDGYAGHIVEDHLTGMKFYAKNWKSVYVPDILAVGEGPSTWDAYFSQQMRWAYGLFDIFFKHSPKIFFKLKLNQIFNYFILQNFYFYGLAQVLAILLLTLYFWFGLKAANMELGELLILYIPILYIQQVIFIWLQRFYINPQDESGFHIKGRLLSLAVWPIYFLALLSLIRGKKLNYKVTPKNVKDLSKSHIKLFLPHVVLGGLTLSGIIVSFYNHNQSIHLLALALLNTLILFAFVGIEITKKISWEINQLKQRQFVRYISRLKLALSS